MTSSTFNCIFCKLRNRLPTQLIHLCLINSVVHRLWVNLLQISDRTDLPMIQQLTLIDKQVDQQRLDVDSVTLVTRRFQDLENTWQWNRQIRSDEVFMSTVTPVEQIRRVSGDNFGHFAEAILMSTHSICFYGEPMKTILQLSSNTLLIWPSVWVVTVLHKNISFDYSEILPQQNGSNEYL